jgi:hypothetical protein
VVALLAAAALTGCGQDAEEAYCETLSEERKVLDDLEARAQEPGVDTITPTLESLRRLREAAPEELTDEYSTVVYAVEALVEAVDEAGIDISEYDREETLAELDPAVARRLRQTAATLRAPRITEATAGIEDHALQVCDVDFTV